MSRQPFLTIVGLMKHALTATKRPFLSVLAILLLVPAVAAAGDPLSSWDTQMNAKGRFDVLPAFNNEAVLDKETQLVWEKAPNLNFRHWGDATRYCLDKNVGVRKGWRLPSIAELASLVDPANSDPALPTGHPFIVQSDDFWSYWSATTLADNSANAWDVNFGNGSVGDRPKTNFLSLTRAWCVRGGMNADQY